MSWYTSRQMAERKRIPLHKIYNIDEQMCPLTGSITHIYGTNNSGRTTLAINLSRAMSMENPEYGTIYFPAKIEFSHHQVADIPRFFIVTTSNIDQCFITIDQVLSKHGKFLFVIDDLSLMHAAFETDYRETTVGKYLEHIKNLIRLNINNIALSESILILTSQMRVQINQGRLAAQMRFINELSDFIYEMRTIEHNENERMIGITATNKIEYQRKVFYIGI